MNGVESKKEYFLSVVKGGSRSKSRVIIVDKTEINNELNFCYERKTYKSLLYNGQIIKKGGQCPVSKKLWNN